MLYRSKPERSLSRVGVGGVHDFRDEEPAICPLPKPTAEALLEASMAVARRVKPLLIRRGDMNEEGTPSDEVGTDALPERLRFGCLSEDGRAVHAEPREGQLGKSSADVAGFSVHAGVSVSGHDREALERLAPYVARPPVAHEQLAAFDDGRIALR